MSQVYNQPDFKRDSKWVRYTDEGSDRFTTRAGTLWTNLVARTTKGSAAQLNEPTYQSVTNQFADFDEFAEWCQHQPGYLNKNPNGTFWQLDKDVMVPGNTAYSSDTCCFLPHRINSLFATKKPSKLGLLPGVFKGGKSKYAAKINNRYLGSFTTQAEAHAAWVRAKAAIIVSMVDEYPELPPEVHAGLNAHADLILSKI